MYFVVEYLPSSRLDRSAGKALTAAVSLVDPDRELRDARTALELLPSAQNQLRLARALLARGETAEAVKQFDACLAGPFGGDPEIRYAAAAAKLADGQTGAALALAQQLRQRNPEFNPERVAILLAQAYAASGDSVGAQTEYAAALERFGSVEVRGQYAIFAAQHADLVTAERLYGELTQAAKHWPSHALVLNKTLLRGVENAIATARRGA